MSSDTCDHLLLTDRRRGCRVEDCEHWREGAGKVIRSDWVRTPSAARPKKPRRPRTLSPEKQAERDARLAEKERLNAEKRAQREERRKAQEAVEARRMELYNQGLSDAEITETTGAGKSTIARWRQGLELPANPGPEKRRRTEALALLAQGLTQREVAEKLGYASVKSISRISCEERDRKKAAHDERILTLWKQGMTDQQIADELSYKSRQSVAMWRSRHGLPSNGTMRREQIQKLFEAGYSDQQIAAELGIAVPTVIRHRNENGLLRQAPRKKEKGDGKP